MELLKNLKFMHRLIPTLLFAYCLTATGCSTSTAPKGKNPLDSAVSASGDTLQTQPIVLKTMGSFLFGGTVTQTKEGEVFHGDHGYAQYYIPQHAREYPLVLWHGIGQSGKSWESTPDGREGFMSILPRRDWAVYIIDQPRRGRAGYTPSKTDEADAVPTTLRESSVWNAFRNGIWTPPAAATFFNEIQFPKDSAYAIDQFFRQQTPDTGALPHTAAHRDFLGKTVGDLFRRIGPGVLVTHSHSGHFGWATAMNVPDLVKAVVAFEPGQFTFPEGERPAEIPTSLPLVETHMQPQMVPVKEFEKLTRMPMIIIYGDNIAKEPSQVFNVDLWRVASRRARQFVEAVNRHGGDAKLLMLPEIGIKGNTHAPFADRNNIAVAEIVEAFLHSKGLDKRAHPHWGPGKKPMKLTIPLKEN